MSWLPLYDQGKTPADYTASAGMSVHGGNLPSELLRRRNPFAEAIKAIAPQVAAYLKQKKLDEIANSFQNMVNPPRAGAVDSNAYDPSLAASQGLGNYQEGGDSPQSYARDSQGPPATKPYQGGAEGNAANQLYQKYLAQQEAAKSDTATNDLNYQVLYRKAHPEEFPDKTTGPQYVNTDQGRMTAHEASVIRRDQNKITSRGVGGLTLDQLNQPDYVRYEDKDGNQISTEQANANPENAFAVPPNAKQRTPYKQWTSAADLFRQAQGRAGGQPAPTLQGSGPTTNKTPVQVSTPEEANALTPGTYYLTPDGKLHKR